MKETFKVRVVKEHAGIKEVFPLGFETTFTKEYTKKDKVTPGFWTIIHGKETWVD